MKRRDFLKNTGIVAAASMVPFVAQANDDMLSPGIHLLWDGSIWVNTASPYQGTNFPVGTQAHPVNNLADAKRIKEIH